MSCACALGFNIAPHVAVVDGHLVEAELRGHELCFHIQRRDALPDGVALVPVAHPHGVRRVHLVLPHEWPDLVRT